MNKNHGVVIVDENNSTPLEFLCAVSSVFRDKMYRNIKLKFYMRIIILIPRGLIKKFWDYTCKVLNLIPAVLYEMA